MITKMEEYHCGQIMLMLCYQYHQLLETLTNDEDNDDEQEDDEEEFLATN